MKNPQISLNSLLIFFIFSFFGCVSSQTQQNDLSNFKINFILDNYIDFYSRRVNNFNSKEKYLMLSISKDINENKTYLYLFDNCYDCPSIDNNKYLILLYRGYKIIVATDNANSKEIILKNFKNTSTGTHFKVIPYDSNSTYDYPRQWEFIYDDKGNLIFFCNSDLSELEEIKKILSLDKSIEDCNPNIK